MPGAFQQLKSQAAQIVVDEWHMNGESPARFPSTPVMAFRAMDKTFNIYPEDLTGLSLNERMHLTLFIYVAARFHFRALGINTELELVD
jgi:hypothetical protein